MEPKYPNSGILFPNRSENPKAPVHKGSGAVQCPHCHEHFEFDIAGWVREGKTGEFLTLKLKPKD